MYIGPKKRPQDFGFKQGDFHIVVNDGTETAKAFDFTGNKLWEVPALARGQGSDYEYRYPRTDTPPGVYEIGEIYRDYKSPRMPAFDRTKLAYGWYSFDLVDLEAQERKWGRAGIMIHGGGSACGWPGAWAPKQTLYPTHGCVRMYNQDLRDLLLPLCEQSNTVYVSVYQEQ
jgi:lipoprotein-anchoring transpeptidase ErfK/SrfK